MKDPEEESYRRWERKQVSIGNILPMEKGVAGKHVHLFDEHL